MAIEFACECGRPLRAKDDWAGKKTHCPTCHATIVIPKPAGPVAEQAAQEAKPAKESLSEAIPVDFSLTESNPSNPAISHPEGQAPLIQIDRLPGDDHAGADDDHDPHTGRHHAYRVLTPKDYGIAAKFNAEALEKALNDYGKKGWSLKSACVMSVPTHSGPHDEIILILER